MQGNRKCGHGKEMVSSRTMTQKGYKKEYGTRFGSGRKQQCGQLRPRSDEVPVENELCFERVP
jgi:hypothetical protein